MCMIFI